MNSRSIQNYRIAYLIDTAAVPSDSFVSADTITTLTGAVVLSSWEAFLEANNEQTFEIVLVHSSLYDRVDVEWTREAYRNKIILVGFNLTYQQLSELTGDRCTRNPFKRTPTSADTFLYFTYSLELEDERYRESIHQAVLETCTNYDAGGTWTQLKHGVTGFPIHSTTELGFVVDALVMSTARYDLPASTELEP
jgi:hypothetical protein